MRKAQIEMMGFVMVVILVTIGLFFSVTLKQPPSTKRAFTVYSDEKLASNFLITLLETDVGEAGYEHVNLHDLAVDCVRKNVGTPHYGFDACQKAEDIATTILQETLEQWSYTYNLTYTYTDPSKKTTTLFTISNGACTKELSAPGLQPISLYRVTSGSALMRLEICA